MKNDTFIDLAKYVSSQSKDKSTKTGAVITSKDNKVLCTGLNQFPNGSNDKILERYEVPEKYLWTEHAERNAIYFAAKNGININDTTMYLTWFPCCDCARAIIQSGISKIVCEKPDFDNKKWGYSFKFSLEMLKECGITIEYV